MIKRDDINVGITESLGELEPAFPAAAAALDGESMLLLGVTAGGSGDEGTLPRAAFQLRSTAERREIAS
jgi:hypothetical protein